MNPVVELRRVNIRRLKAFIQAAYYQVADVDPEAVGYIKERIDELSGCSDRNVGQACWSLARQMLKDSQDEKNTVIDLMAGDSGFVLLLGFDDHGLLHTFVWGNLRDEHPDAYLVLTMLMKRFDLLEQDRFGGYQEPLSPSWLSANVGRLSRQTVAWSLRNLDLLPAIMLDWYKSQLKVSLPDRLS